MSYFSCNRPDDHKREGRDDFERRGRYGYDSFKYEDPFDDCNRAYTDGFNEARREDERREEHRMERNARERRQYLRDQEEDYYNQMYYEQQEPPPPERNQIDQPKDDLPF